jgi:hypothetical protein
VTALVIRVIATVVVVIMSGLPVAGLLCARECTETTHQARTADEEHCHDDAAGDALRLSSGESDGCTPFNMGDVAARDRVTVSLASAAVPDGPPLRVGGPATHIGSFSAVAVTRLVAGLSPGALRPLRI